MYPSQRCFLNCADNEPLISQNMVSRNHERGIHAECEKTLPGHLEHKEHGDKDGGCEESHEALGLP